MRKTLVPVLGGVFLTLAVATSALAQDLKIMAPAGPGGGWDQTARAMQAALQAEGIVKNVQVTNVPGAGGIIGLAQFANQAKGDPNALMVGGNVMIGAIITNKAAVNLSQVTPIARLIGEYSVVVVPASSPIKSVKDLVEKLKADPAHVSWAGGSAGGSEHIAVGLIASAVGVDPRKVNYIPFSGGGEALAAILGSKVTAGISGYSEFEPQIKAGQLRVLAVSAPQRLPGIDAPTLKEEGVDVEVQTWRSVSAAPGITPAQRAQIIAMVEKMAKSKTWQDTLKTKGWSDALLSGDAFDAFLQKEIQQIGAALKAVGLAQ